MMREQDAWDAVFKWVEKATGEEKLPEEFIAMMFAYKEAVEQEARTRIALEIKNHP